ncbi:hypothetical protein [Providencia rettgeri]|uniref:hypothetical protein n=1 Tax=Providencia rettgeri TaxID=587 RepID=UPI002360ED72|nr:hypothetical protein [Providencia rettgeri]
MKKGLVVLLLGLVSIGSFASTANIGTNERPEITEDDVVPDMAARLNNFKSLICDDIKDGVRNRSCKRMVDDVAAIAYFHGEASMGCKLKADDPEFKKVPKMDEFCDKAQNLISNLSPNVY